MPDWRPTLSVLQSESAVSGAQPPGVSVTSRGDFHWRQASATAGRKCVHASVAPTHLRTAGTGIRSGLSSTVPPGAALSSTETSRLLPRNARKVLSSPVPAVAPPRVSGWSGGDDRSMMERSSGSSRSSPSRARNNRRCLPTGQPCTVVASSSDIHAPDAPGYRLRQRLAAIRPVMMAVGPPAGL